MTYSFAVALINFSILRKKEAIVWKEKVTACQHEILLSSGAQRSIGRYPSSKIELKHWFFFFFPYFLYIYLFFFYISSDLNNI